MSVCPSVIFFLAYKYFTLSFVSLHLSVCLSLIHLVHLILSSIFSFTVFLSFSIVCLCVSYFSPSFSPLPLYFPLSLFTLPTQSLPFFLFSLSLFPFLSLFLSLPYSFSLSFPSNLGIQDQTSPAHVSPSSSPSHPSTPLTS